MHLLQLISRRALLGGALSLFLIACGGGPEVEPSGKQPSGKLKVTATVNMVADLVRQVGGEHVELTELMGPGVDPHLYQATLEDVEKLNNADVVFYVGLYLEGKIEKTLQNLKTAHGVADQIDKDKLLASEDYENKHDPHIWFDVNLWMETVDVVVDGLSAADSANAADYNKNGEAEKSKMKELQTWAEAKVAELPKDKRILITSHDAYNYFGRAYDFQVVGLQGISTEGEAGLADVVKMVSFIKEKGIKAVFVESSVNPAAIQRISEDSGAKVGGELFSDAMGELGKIENGHDVGTYEGMIKHNLSTIVNALK